jgi:hypothetical protein
VQRVQTAPFSSDKLAQIELAARSTMFRAAQVKLLLDAVPFSIDKIQALTLLRKIADPENAGVVVAAFPFATDRERARQILRE